MKTLLAVNANCPTRFVVSSLSVFLSAVAIASCSAVNQTSATMEMQQAAIAPAAAPMPVPAGVANAVATSVPKAQPALIKRAEMTVVVKSIEQSLKSVSSLVQQQQGDIVGMQSSNPQDVSVRQTASMQIRVPQAQLETTLDAIAQLGTVQSRSLTAEDVSDRLVDTEAQVRNLRKSEEALLKIMERSGSIGDVLKVAQELSNVRQSIEQLDAQLKNLRNQVAYSTISLSLEVPVSAVPEPQPVSLRVQETWGKATHSVNELTLGLIGSSLWVLAFSPYLILVGAAIAFGLHYKKKHATPPTPPQHQSDA